MENMFTRANSRSSIWSENSIPEDLRSLYRHTNEISSSSSSSEETSVDQSSIRIASNHTINDNNISNLQAESEAICSEYIALSDGDVYRHPYYYYPPVVDPGITPALLNPTPPRPSYCEDGIDLYKALCDQVNEVPVRLFYYNLLNPTINLSYYCVSQEGVRIMARALQFNRHVRRFDLTDTFLNVDACYHLGQMIKVNSYLQELILNGCRIKESGLSQLGAELNVNVSLKTLSIARNDLTDNGGQISAKLIMNGANLNNINLSNNKLGVKTLLALNEAFIVNRYLTHIDISENPCIHIPTMIKFIQTLASTSKRLEHLNLSRMQLQDVRLAEAIALIMLLPTLKSLNLSGNWFSDDSAPNLVANLMLPKHLKTYNLSYNKFSPKGACIILQKLLSPRVKLKILHLDNICVNRDFMELLAKVKSLKCRKNFVVTHDKVLHDWTAAGKDPRYLVLKRGEYLGKTKSGTVVKVDVPLFLLSLSYAADHLRAKEVLVMMKLAGIGVDGDWVKALIDAFPGPLITKKRTLNTKPMREYIRRLWPEKHLPPDFVPPIIVQVDVKRRTKSTMELAPDEEKKVKGNKGKRKKHLV